MGTLQPARRTQLTDADIYAACSEAYKMLEGESPTSDVAALLAAQVALETGHAKSMWNYNFGNVKKTRQWTGDWTTFKCGENLGDGHKLYPAGSPQCLFRSYPTAALGAKDYVAVIRRRSEWWAGLHTGSPSAYNAALCKKPYAYYTASSSVYLSGLQSLFLSFGGELKSLPVSSKSVFKSVGSPIERATLPVLRGGSDGPAVELWQSILGMAKADGKFGADTVEQTRRWQSSRGLLPDGIVGPRTWREV